ncbi:hypothetical protein [Streptomyces sp. URMC 123]|uniref:hypothetical protein n=1 Tax=Streptomyces sp. URMC 123 TaxID=3423403 RepID=UPI003F529E46
MSHNNERSGYGYSDDEVRQMIEAVRAVDNPDSRYVITVNMENSEGVFQVLRYGMTYWTFEEAKRAAQWRVNRSPGALCGHVRIVAPSGASFKVGTVWPSAGEGN